jgi:diguanylate cyclase (GGDEF)-like protein
VISPLPLHRPLPLARKRGPGARLLDAPLGWSAVARALLLQGFLLPFLMLSFFESSWFLLRPELAPYFSVADLATYNAFIGAVTLYGTVLFAVGLYMRGHQPGSVLYQLLVAVFACLWPIGAGYYFGLHISGMIAAFLAASVLAVVLLDRWVALVGVLTGVLGAVVLSALEQARLVRHAPLLLEAPFDAQGLQGSWFWGVGASVFLASLLVIFLVDQLVRKEREYARLLRGLAVTDALTGAANRRHFIDSLERELQRAQRFAFPVSIVLLDIDHFKRVNDTQGHHVGDEVLVGVVARLAERLRDSDMLARYGGEEFVLLLSHLGIEGATEAAERLRAILADAPLRIGELELPITASFGVASAEPDQGLDVVRLLRRADAAMYAAKAAGRDRVRPWSPDDEDTAE